MSRTSLHLVVLATALAAAPGCTKYARVSSTNAPGVIDISTPPVREDGSDELYELPAYDQPKSDAIVAWVHPYFAGGLVRYGSGFELGFGLSIEKDSDAPAGTPINQNAWGATLGFGIVQVSDPAGGGPSRTDAPGPLSIEAYYRKFIVMFGAGAVVYPDTRKVGGQITIHAPLCHAQLRYVQGTGFEAMFAWDLSFPFVFGWSR